MTAPSVLVVSDFTWNLEKVDRHVGPLADVADVTMVSINAPEDPGAVSVRTVPGTGIRPLDLLLMGLLAVVEALRGDYDAVASFSLLPHGCVALVAGRLAGVPVHLGIIGIDVDVHATARYGPVVRRLLRRFDVVSVPGTAFRAELVRFGVDPDRIEILVNPIPVEAFEPPAEGADRPIDCLWVGRFSREKDPLLFVETVARLRAEGRDPRAVMVGDGPRSEAVADAIREHGLGDVIELPGWVEDPTAYYRRARTFLLTSRREALPLTLLEAMACGTVPVVPEVGNVRDAVTDGRDGVIVAERTPAAFAAAVRRLAADPDEREAMAANAPAVCERYSCGRAAADWRRILDRMGCPGESERTVAGRADD